MIRNCYFCPRKAECYTEKGLATLTPDNASDCGALYTDFDEAREFIYALYEAIEGQGETVKREIAVSLAKHYDCDLDTVWNALVPIDF